jgi:type II secretion system protein G
MKVLKKKGFTLVELLVVVAILAVLAAILLPKFLGYADRSREATAMKDIRSMCTVVEAFAATDGNYPEASLDTDNPRSIASIMQSKGVNWTGDTTGKTDPWGNPYYYDVVDDYYCIASSGKNGTLGDNDDICNIGGKASKKASGLDGNAIPSAVPGNNPGNGNEPGHITEVPEGYIGIYTPEQLASIGVDPDYPRDGNYIVMKDLDLSGYENWTPIGDISPQFTGTFDGNNYVISNLTINSDKNYIGLFGCISETSEIKKIGLENINVAGGDYVGGLVGKNYGTITDCYATGEVTGNENTGGLVGYNQKGSITNCYATGEVRGADNTGGLVGSNYGTLTDCYTTAKVTGNKYTGGLVGDNRSIIKNCYATGKVTGNNRTGGLVGYNSTGCTIENCYATGEVTGDSYTGGLVGQNYSSSITSCYATGSVSGNNDRTGGLVGYNSTGCTIENCYATGEVTGDSYTGGLAGQNNGTIENCYTTGNVNGVNRTGGLVGYNSTGCTIENCYATGEVTGDSYTGGLVGRNSGTITNSYYNLETTGQSDDDGRGSPLTTAKMKDQVNFSNWDFVETWLIDNSYPYLQTNEQIPHPGT